MSQVVLISELYKDGYGNFIQLIALKMNADKHIIPVHEKKYKLNALIRENHKTAKPRPTGKLTLRIKK